MIQLDVDITGDAELDHALEALLAPYGARSIDAAMRKACREAVKEIVKPEVMARVPHRYGTLASKIVVRAVKGARRTIGFYVGFPDGLFRGETFYGGFIEFGWDHYKGVTVQADSFLREALYPNSARIIAHVQQRMREWVAEANSMHTYGEER